MVHFMCHTTQRTNTPSYTTRYPDIIGSNIILGVSVRCFWIKLIFVLVVWVKEMGGAYPINWYVIQSGLSETEGLRTRKASGLSPSLKAKGSRPRREPMIQFQVQRPERPMSQPVRWGEFPLSLFVLFMSSIDYSDYQVGVVKSTDFNSGRERR